MGQPGEFSEVLKTIGSGIAGRGYQIGPTLHGTAGIYNCPMGRGGKKAGSLGKSASAQLSHQFMPELKTGNSFKSQRENTLVSGTSVLIPLTCIQVSARSIPPFTENKQSAQHERPCTGEHPGINL